MTKRPHADLIKLWAEGARIEVLMKGRWQECLLPTWEPALSYRLLEPEIKVRVALLRNSAGHYTWSVSNKDAELSIQKSQFFVRWLTEWTSYPINQPQKEIA